jgi:nifR3 family TIM-barrel protein
MTIDLTQLLNRPLSIGNRTIRTRLVLAPMSMLGHVAFRELLASFGGYGLLFTEMCSAGRIPHESRHASAYFNWRDEELSTLVCQIVGEDPATMAAAARIIEDHGFFGVDINFGCSAASICGRNCGAALLKEPSRAAQIVAAVRKSVSIPVFVKFRTGWQNKPEPAVDQARRFADAGADALTFHPRVAPDRRARPPRWDYIGLVKQAVKIPVFGNGDVFSREDCRKMLQITGCDGVALGRIGIAKPWIFAAWSQGFEPGATIYLDTAINLTQLMSRHFDQKKALRRFKRFALYFCANFRFGHTLYTRIHNADSLQLIQGILYDFFKTSPELLSRPNMNLLR